MHKLWQLSKATAQSLECQRQIVFFFGTVTGKGHYNVSQSCDIIPFWHVFADDLVEKNQKEVKIHDVDPLALTLLVDFSYTGEIVISEDNVQVSNTH